MNTPAPLPEADSLAIVFLHLRQAIAEEKEGSATVRNETEADLQELAEIDELRRYANEVARPAFTFFSGT